MIRWVELREQRHSASSLLRKVSPAGRIAEPERLARALGVQLSTASVDDGLATLTFDGSAASIVLPPRVSDRRRAFAVATLLGHLMMSRPGAYAVDCGARAADPRHGPPLRFAAELLMPGALARAERQLTLRFGPERRSPLRRAS